MPKLRDSPDDLAALIARTADHLELSPTFVEKDFWVTEVLRISPRGRAYLDRDGAQARS